jgi:hypothetical protein
LWYLLGPRVREALRCDAMDVEDLYIVDRRRNHPSNIFFTRCKTESFSGSAGNVSLCWDDGKMAERRAICVFFTRNLASNVDRGAK